MILRPAIILSPISSMVLTYSDGLPTLILMFERFTNRARHAVVLAQEEARRLQHNYIGTEHVLLGLLGEPDGLACRALEGVGMSLESARGEVTAIVGTGAASLSGHIPFTPRAKKTLELALREALQLHHNYIGTEHILLGLMRQGEGVATQILSAFGADAEAVRAEVIRQLGGPGTVTVGPVRRWPEVESLPRPGRGGMRSSLLSPAAMLAAGWLLFALALGAGILVGWAIWG